MSDFSLFREWAYAVGTLVVAGIATRVVRVVLRKLAQARGWQLLTALAPALASLVYVIGLKAFADIAPLGPKLDSWLDSFIYVVAVAIVLRILRRTLLEAIQWSASRSNNAVSLEQGFVPLIRNLVTVFVFVTGAIMVLQRFHYDVMSLVTALGVGSLAVGLAAQATLSNMFSGFILMIDRNVRHGDLINLSGTEGTVLEIGLRSTLLRTGDGNLLIVPNSNLVNNQILNLSLPQPEVACSTRIRVPLSVPFDRVRKLCAEAAAKVQDTPQEHAPAVQLTKLGKKRQIISVSFWVRNTTDQSRATSELLEILLAKLQAEGIAAAADAAPRVRN